MKDVNVGCAALLHTERDSRSLHPSDAPSLHAPALPRLPPNRDPGTRHPALMRYDDEEERAAIEAPAAIAWHCPCLPLQKEGSARFVPCAAKLRLSDNWPRPRTARVTGRLPRPMGINYFTGRCTRRRSSLATGGRSSGGAKVFLAGGVSPRNAASAGSPEPCKGGRRHRVRKSRRRFGALGSSAPLGLPSNWGTLSGGSRPRLQDFRPCRGCANPSQG